MPVPRKEDHPSMVPDPQYICKLFQLKESPDTFRLDLVLLDDCEVCKEEHEDVMMTVVCKAQKKGGKYPIDHIANILRAEMVVRLGLLTVSLGEMDLQQMLDGDKIDTTTAKHSMDSRIQHLVSQYIDPNAKPN